MCRSQDCTLERTYEMTLTKLTHFKDVSVSVCVCVFTNSKLFVITFDLAHGSRQGYGYYKGKGKHGAILLGTVIVSSDYLPSAPQQQHPPHFPTDNRPPSLNFTVDYP